MIKLFTLRVISFFFFKSFIFFTKFLEVEAATKVAYVKAIIAALPPNNRVHFKIF